MYIFNVNDFKWTLVKIDMSNETVSSNTLDKRSTVIAVIIIGAMFFIFGLVSWVNAILIPYFKIACELTHFESYFVAFAFYIAYLVMSVPSAFLLKRVGYKKGMMVGFFFMAAGALIFVPAALTRTYGIFLTGLFTIGTGLAILQSAANPYITIVGPIESAAKRMSIMGVCNKFAGIVSPLIFAAVVLKVSDSDMFTLLESGTLDEVAKNNMLDELIRRVILPIAYFRLYSLHSDCLFVFQYYRKLILSTKLKKKLLQIMERNLYWIFRILFWEHLHCFCMLGLRW